VSQHQRHWSTLICTLLTLCGLVQGKHADIAEKMIAHAGLSDRITVLRGTLAELLHKEPLRDLVFDVVFLDHDKRHYVPVSWRAEALQIGKSGLTASPAFRLIGLWLRIASQEVVHV